jgi:hypothetical protein
MDAKLLGCIPPISQGLIKPNPKIFLAFQRHGVFFSKERPAVDAWPYLIFGRPGFAVKSF